MTERRRAFTLVELVISMLISGLVMASVIALLFSVFKSYEVHQDVSEAKQRGQIALVAIQPYVLNAGLGLPNTTSTFQTAFSGLTELLPAQQSRKFRGFVELASDKTDVVSGSVTSSPALWLVYSVPSGAGVRREYPDNPTTWTNPLQVKVDRYNILDPSSHLSINAAEIKSWIAFPSASSPFRVLSYNDGAETLSLNFSADQRVSAYDEIHFVRAAKIYVHNNMLIINRLDGSGEQAVTEGVSGLWCTFDAAGDRILTVRVLARSSTRRGDQQQGDIEGWPASASPTRGSLDSAYRYAVVSRSWRIRN